MKFWQMKKDSTGINCIYAGDEMVTPVGFVDSDANRLAVGRAEVTVEAHNSEVRLAGDDVVQRLLKIVGMVAVPTPLESLLEETPVSAIERGDLSPFHEMEYLHAAEAWAPFRAAISERVRQIGVHGYDAAHDDEHKAKEILDGALFFAMRARSGFNWLIGKLWPLTWKKPEPWGDSTKADIKRAMAMLAAEWSRIDRIEGKRTADKPS